MWVCVELQERPFSEPRLFGGEAAVAGEEDMEGVTASQIGRRKGRGSRALGGSRSRGKAGGTGGPSALAGSRGEGEEGEEGGNGVAEMAFVSLDNVQASSSFALNAVFIPAADN